MGELAELPIPSAGAATVQFSQAHVGQVRDLTRRLGETGNVCGVGPAVLSVATAWAEQLLGVPDAESMGGR